MLYQNQLIQHDPDNGQYGDCFRTCVANLLDLPPDVVPHVMDGVDEGDDAKDAVERMNYWLNDSRGLQFVEIPFTSVDISPKRFLEIIARYAGDEQRYILTAMGTSGVPHSVVCRGSVMEHCPAGLTIDDITGPILDEAENAEPGTAYYWVGFLAKVL